MEPGMLKEFIGGSAILIIAIAALAQLWAPIGWILWLVVPAILLGIYDAMQTRHAIRRNFPFVGHFRYILESIGPEMNQYFVESATDGRPIDRNERTYVYSRAKRQVETHPFGTELDLLEPGYVYMQHSMYPTEELHEAPRVMIGGPDCTQPYSASVLNISAMSYGSLSAQAITALNIGAREGNFFHCTGEGGISPFHLKGGDICFQVGTGYFGARTPDGAFSPEHFAENAKRPEVKLIELKLSQGAKPGHGGILPASKNNEEIASIRGVTPHTAVESPGRHSAFEGPEGLIEFVATLRGLSGGKPVGFKFCVGDRKEFTEVCRVMSETGVTPDFITVDGAEGGTGAAPIDFSNYVGLPLEEGLTTVDNLLREFGLRERVKIIAAGKIVTAFDLYRTICLGADLCNSSRAMMLALGCIQALKCHTNKCPTGVATNEPTLTRGLVVEQKWHRVRNYHDAMVHDFLSLMAAAGVTELSQLDRSRVHKRLSAERVVPMETIYPTPTVRELG
jgi:glutamate synthase domain-containing protein 2